MKDILSLVCRPFILVSALHVQNTRSVNTVGHVSTWRIFYLLELLRISKTWRWLKWIFLYPDTILFHIIFTIWPFVSGKIKNKTLWEKCNWKCIESMDRMRIMDGGERRKHLFVKSKMWTLFCKINLGLLYIDCSHKCSPLCCDR